MKALIIDEPWISLILSGVKTWEMRSSTTSHRGTFALIRKGSGTIVGTANITGCSGPLPVVTLRQNADKHRVPVEEFESGRAMKWNFAWELSDAKSLGKPVPYEHPNGAVKWVNLTQDVVAALHLQMESLPLGVSVQSPATSDVEPLQGGVHFEVHPGALVPVAKDGTWFGPHLMRAGAFQVGEKGDEQRFATFAEALSALRRMPVARWRRPNAVGNWGIVSAVEWRRLGNFA